MLRGHGAPARPLGCEHVERSGGILCSGSAYDNDRKLLSSSRDAKGSTESFTYDPLGRLINVKDPTGNESNLTPNALPDGFGVTFKSPEGRSTTAQRRGPPDWHEIQHER